jgi:hypothetical protein
MDAETRLNTLRNLLNRWADEYAEVAAADPDRGAHHAEAILDLNRLISRLEQQRGTHASKRKPGMLPKSGPEAGGVDAL